MKLLKYFFILILIVLIATSVYIAVQPSAYELKRSRVIEAAPAVIYQNIQDYKNWEHWGPWQEEDSTMTYSYPEHTEGIGGAYSWTGRDGNGSMETVKAEENKSLDQKLSFEDFEPSDVYWRLNEVESGTEVTWGMKGDKNFMFKLYTTFMGSMDKTVGPMYERGLEKLDSIIIADTKKYNIHVNGLVTHPGGYYIYNETTCKTEEIGLKIQEMMPKLGVYASNQNIEIAGMPFTSYSSWNTENGTTTFICAIPTKEKIQIDTANGILSGEMKTFKAVKCTLKGNYTNLQEAWETTMRYMNENNLTESNDGPHMEIYANDPGNFPNPSDWLTEIYVAIEDK